MNRFFVFLSLACFGLFMCVGCGDDKGAGPPPPFTLPSWTSPENVFANLDYAMNQKDIELFEDLLDDEYWFFSPSQRDTPDYMWDKTEDVKLTGRVFEYFDKVEYELMETGVHWIEYGVNLAPEDATDISAEHPDENWEVFQRPVTLYLLDETERRASLYRRILSLRCAFRRIWRPEPRSWIWRPESRSGRSCGGPSMSVRARSPSPMSGWRVGVASKAPSGDPPHG
ncbi:MAG: hypothetical protein J7M27_03735 [Candidatus Latescibacteria bacterium]|nr:hypothetical protein [Candidatus Latescibacterota bacterium]